jgi:DNA invertase Pin-like site-specific DNA recombinase
VATYARVSTLHDEQLHSLSAQKDYYRKYIRQHPGWEFVGIYADSGISGGSVQARAEFQRMITDCIAGKIDLIVTKSVSRFARNTLDTLNTLQQLRQLHIGVFFEQENINSLDRNGDLLLAVLAGYAQEESRSISENTKWAIRNGYSKGVYHFPFARLLGYNAGMEVNAQQAVTVRHIFRSYLQGKSCYAIAKTLNEHGVPTTFGGKKWLTDTILSILHNEKYKGDVLLQKKYIPDYTTHQQVKNDGELAKYYIHDAHEAIIAPFVFDKVQERLQNPKPSKVHPLSGVLQCACCGGYFRPVVWHSTTTHDRVWKCCQKNIHIYEKDLYDAVRKIWYKLTGMKATLLDFDDLTLILDSITVHPTGRLTFRFVDGSRKMVKITR